MTKTWLIRRPVRSRFPRDDRPEKFIGVQAALHQQFRPALANQLHRLCARRPDYAACPLSPSCQVRFLTWRDLSNLSRWAYQNRIDQSLCAGLDRACQRRFSHGWATAVGTGYSSAHRSKRLSYLPVPLVIHSSTISTVSGTPAGPVSSQHEGQYDCQPDSIQQRLECHLVMFQAELSEADTICIAQEDWPTQSSQRKDQKLIAPVEVPLSSGGLASLITVYGSIAAPDAMPIRCR